MMMPRVMSVSGGGDVGAREGFCVSCKEMLEPGGLRKPKMLRCYHTFCRYVCSQIVRSQLKTRPEDTSNPQSRGVGKNLSIFGENLLIYSKKKGHHIFWGFIFGEILEKMYVNRGKFIIHLNYLYPCCKGQVTTLAAARAGLCLLR